MKRRQFMKKGALAVAAAGILPACETDDGAGGDEKEQPKPIAKYEYTGDIGPKTLFSHGVASGDPLHDRVILWTRVTFAKPPTEAVEVFWEVAKDADFADRVAAGTTKTSAERDWTVKVDAEGLQAGTRYHYRFWLQGRSSDIGRTLTTPTGPSEKLRFAVCSCARYSSGYYIGYGAIAARDDIAAVLHLGDYIYESDGGGGFRPNDPPHACATLQDYRLRYARQRTDGDLQVMHQRHPMIAVWDDHEVANNGYKSGATQFGHDEKTHGPWEKRKAAGMQAWHEWMPVRDQADGRIWRAFSYGDLLDLVMLDTRYWGRQRQETRDEKKKINAPARTLMGADQETWLAEQVTTGKGRWVVVGQQVMCAPLKLGDLVLNPDQWDGYPASRKRMFDAFDSRKTKSAIVLAGDIHSSWANELVGDPKGYTAGSNKAHGVEFVAPGITSSFPDSIPESVVETGVKSNPHIRWFELGSKGFIVLELTEKRAQADWYFYKDIKKKETKPAFATALYVEHGKSALHKTDKKIG